MALTSRGIPWRYRLGMWLTSHRLPFGTKFMAWEIARMTVHLSHVERNQLLRRVTAEVESEIQAYARARYR